MTGAFVPRDHFCFCFLTCIFQSLTGSTGSNTLLWSSELSGEWSDWNKLIEEDTFMMISRNFVNNAPCSGLEKKSPTMSAVGQYSTRISLASIRSWIKKYRTFKCRVRLLLDARPLFSNSIALWLSWYTIASLVAYPCASRKYLVIRSEQ